MTHSSSNAKRNDLALTHKQVTVEGVRMHYVKVGTGPVVLCMHGWPQNHREFLPVIEAFADRYTVAAGRTAIERGSDQ